MTSLDVLRNAGTPTQFLTGATIFDEGDRGDVMYGVIEGEVEVLIDGHPVEIVEPGGIIGEMALVDDSPRSATARARRDCSLVRIDQRQFTLLVVKNPLFAVQVMAAMADRLRRMNHRS